MNDEPPLEELVRKRGPKKFVKSEYGSKPEVEEVIDYNILEGIESEGVLVEVDYVEKVREEKTKKGYVIQEKKTTGKWDLLEIKGDKEDLIDSMTYPVKEKGKVPFQAIGIVGGGITGALIMDFLINPPVQGLTRLSYDILGWVLFACLGYGIGKDIKRKIKGKKVPKDAKRKRQRALKEIVR